MRVRGTDPPEAGLHSVGGWRYATEAAAAGGGEEDDSSRCSFSSIGKNSDAEGDEAESGEVESCHGYGDGSLEDLKVLEDALPIRRGISIFYNGKSKSFACLTSVLPSSSSMEDMVKPENIYSRKRKNAIASSLTWGDKRKCLQSRQIGTGIATKELVSADQKTALCCSSIDGRTSKHSGSVRINSLTNSRIGKNSNSTQVQQYHLSGKSSLGGHFSTLRSFSMVDIQECAPVATLPKHASMAIKFH